MMSAKLTTLGILKLKMFQNKCYDIIPDSDVTNKILLRDSIYVVDVMIDQSLVTVAFL